MIEHTSPLFASDLSAVRYWADRGILPGEPVITERVTLFGRQEVIGTATIDLSGFPAVDWNGTLVGPSDWVPVRPRLL